DGLCVIEGKEVLTGADMNAGDLRGGAALVIAALSAEGSSRVGEIYHIDRGYERLDEKLSALGADIRRIDI
ncbi:MAG: UDP-N-acetylglucosamine 1-carboxyvinyltransferase, partial [Clostridia bacterium]|nr:UDP-N-acetylglucosamine 1-carboxyvinyltransferase [Clostridia bacterium]